MHVFTAPPRSLIIATATTIVKPEQSCVRKNCVHDGEAASAVGKALLTVGAGFVLGLSVA